MSNFRDQVGDINDYSNMPKFELQQRAIYGDEKAERIYAQRYSQKNKSAELTEVLKKWSAAIKDNLEKGNPNRDDRGRFTFGSGGPQGAGGGGGGGSAEGSSGGGSGSGSTGEIAQGKDITSELGKEYGTTSESKRAQELRTEHMTANYDPVLKDIAHKQGFDGEAEILDQESFDKVVADGGTVTYRGITGYYEHQGPSAKFIEGDAAITDQFAKGKYYAGAGGYGNGTYTTSDISVAQHYASEDGKVGGGMITMVVKPGAKIATPAQWATARIAAKEGKGGFMGSDDPGRILAAQGFDGFRIAAKNVDHFSNQFTVILNRTAVAVLKK